LVKEEVFTGILKEELILGQKLEAYNPVKTNENKIEVEGEEGINKNETETAAKAPLTVLERIKRIFAYWMDNHL
jgi:hypothetical protein